MTSVKAGVFAAGFGTRLGGPARGPKALTLVAGKPLIDWVLDDLTRANASEVAIIINKESLAVRDHVEREADHPIRWIVETTPSSMHSFLRVVEELARHGDPGPFLMSTVDTVARGGTFATFLERAAAFPDADVVLGLTDNLDDEKPFRIGIDGRGGVASVGDGPFATAGYSLVRATVLKEAASARADGLGALREFFARLFARGFRFAAVFMPESIDVDREADVAAAERLVRGTVC